jgi:hypothetical protein
MSPHAHHFVHALPPGRVGLPEGGLPEGLA